MQMAALTTAGVFFSLQLVGCATTAAGGGPTSDAATAAPDLARSIGLTHGPYRFVDAHTYPDESLGYSLKYESADAWVDLYVYPIPADFVGSDEKQQVAEETGRTLDAIDAAMEDGQYQSAKIVRSDLTSTDMGHFVAITELVLLQDGIPLRSFALVTTHDDLFLKVRATHATRGRGQPAMQDVLALSNAFFDAARAKHDVARGP